MRKKPREWLISNFYDYGHWANGPETGENEILVVEKSAYDDAQTELGKLDAELIFAKSDADKLVEVLGALVSAVTSGHKEIIDEFVEHANKTIHEYQGSHEETK